jgi:DNA-binding transcriptional LysR family regulator
MGLVEVGTFVEAASRGSVTAAARALALPKSTVSRRIKRLEDDLGHALLQRDSRRFRLTEAGEQLFRRSASAVRDLEEAERAIRDTTVEPAGELRITAPRDLGASPPLVDLFCGFRRQHPQVRLFVDLNDRLVDIVSEGFDFAIRLHSEPLPEREGIKVRRLGALDAGLYASGDYLDRTGRLAHPDDLTNHECLGTLSPAGTSRWGLRWRGEGANLELELQPGMCSNSMTFVQGAVLAGAGVGILPNFIGANLVGVERVLPGWELPSGTLSLLWPASRYQAPRVRAYVDFLAAGFGRACRPAGD